MTNCGKLLEEHLDECEEISELELTIGEQVELVTEKYGDSAMEINSGNCELFAIGVIEAFGGYRLGAWECWADAMTDCSTQEGHTWSHCFIIFQGRYYDSECPEGVNAWRDLPFFVRNPIK